MNSVPRWIRAECAELTDNWRHDVVAGFLVFLIALPLCFGIAMASDFPPMAGIISAIVGGLLVSRMNGSRLGINGPAAGLITVLFASVHSLGDGDVWAGYRYTLAAIVIVGGLQIVLGWFKAGRWATFFPAAVAHGMLAAIGIIIIARQIHTLIGTRPDFETPWQSFVHLPHSLLHLNSEILLVGGIGLVILFVWPLLGNRGLGRMPAPLLVILTGYLLGRAFDLNQAELYLVSQGEESDLLHRHVYVTAIQFLSDIPDRFVDSFATPDFSKSGTAAFWMSVASLFFIGSLESLLAASAVDRLDPKQRRSDLNRDIAAIGFGNVVSGLIGGMPMITEIVRSSANIGYGARSRWSNFFHGLFLLLFVAFFPHLIRDIPLASLAALLIYAGYRLATPRAFANSLDVGIEQLALFVITIVGILATNILAGVAIAIGVKLLIHRGRGVRLKNLFELSYRVIREGGSTYRIKINGAAIFSNFIVLKSELTEIPEGDTLIFDLTYASLIDHTVMDFLDRYRRDYIARGGRCEIRGLDHYDAYSEHPLAARRRKALK
ncbi:SulP family inorganic anion transporter [Methylolobus aquaticus]|nr:SulP family inorganic anion transporter [Methylolobus aquaticus]